MIGEPRPLVGFDDHILGPVHIRDQKVKADDGNVKHRRRPFGRLAQTGVKGNRHIVNGAAGVQIGRLADGENLAGGTSGALDPASSTEMWYREVDQYDFRKGGFSMATGHFTQVVWAGTQRLGCGMTTCKGLDIIVCNYDPPGNVHGQYAANVKPTGCK